MRSALAILALGVSTVACAGAKPKQQQPDAPLDDAASADPDMLESNDYEQRGETETTSFDTDVDVELSEHETEKHDDADSAASSTTEGMRHANEPEERQDAPSK